MKGIVAEGPSSALRTVDDLKSPEPSPDQILVKTAYLCINHRDDCMAEWGALVNNRPFIPCINASGVVEKVGENAASRFKVGDKVCGCTGIGEWAYSTCQEYFLMDAAVAIRKPERLALQEAATIGVAALAAALGVFDVLNIPVPDKCNFPCESVGSEWVVVLGGCSDVGRFAIRLLKSCGYRVIASCSRVKAKLVKDLGARNVFYNDLHITEQVEYVLQVTGGHVYGIFDAAATGDAFAKEWFAQQKEGSPLFATTDNWSQIPPIDGGHHACTVDLSPIGTDTPEGNALHSKLAAYTDILAKLFEHDDLCISMYDAFEDGFEDVIDVVQNMQDGVYDNKVVVKIWGSGE
ncbi:hypothetical protein VTN02DRAFT_2187 [Thermoascus thermophilus]